MIQCLKKLSIAVDALSASPTKPEARPRQQVVTPERPWFRCHQLGHWARNCPLDKQPQRKVRLVTPRTITPWEKGVELFPWGWGLTIPYAGSGLRPWRTTGSIGRRFPGSLSGPPPLVGGHALPQGQTIPVAGDIALTGGTPPLSGWIR